MTDPTGAPLSAATVTVTHIATQVSQTVVTGVTGDYSLPYLVNGTYTIKAERPGFHASATSRVVLRAAQTVRADIRMPLVEVKQAIEVSASAIALQTDTAVVATTIDSEAINDLPLNGRTFAQLATLVPGVAPQGSRNIGTDRKRGSIGTAFAITASGFSDVQNSFVYDGVPAMDLDSYNFAFSPSIDAIAEFRVQTSTYSSAYGGAPGVRDDGKGIDPAVLSSEGREGHYGLRGMRERATLIGGRLIVLSEVDTGSEVELRIAGSSAYAAGRSRSRFSRKPAPKG